jgi:5,10-methylenetetrahydromethanopterin reductase
MATRVEPSQIGVCIFPTESARQLERAAKLAEALGFGFVGVGDVQDLWADSYVSLTLAATATSKIRLGPWVTNPSTRHPAVTANAIATLNEISNGRAFLGISVGDGSVRLLGSKPPTMNVLAEAISVIRSKWSASSHRNKYEPCPIYWAAAGEKSTRRGASLTDGVIVSGWIVPEMLEQSINDIREGAGERYRDVSRIFNTGISIADERHEAIAAAKPYVARALGRPSSAKVPGWSEAEVENFRAAYNFKQHFKSEQEISRLVPDELVAKKAIAGTPKDCAVLLHQIFDAGFEQVAIIPFGDIEATMRRLADEVLPIVTEMFQ